MPALIEVHNGASNGVAGVESELLAGVTHKGLRAVLAQVEERDPQQPEFLSAVKEVALALQPVFERRPEMLPVFRMMCEPERQIVFRVPWLQVNRGYRVQFSSAVGPYKLHIVSAPYSMRPFAHPTRGTAPPRRSCTATSAPPPMYMCQRATSAWDVCGTCERIQRAPSPSATRATPA
ncbi:hypothetical protein ABPG75_006604, partial [Micractinium tetrahymenae]